MEKFKLAYIVPWPEYQQYQELSDFLIHSWAVEDENNNSICIIEKDWLDATLKREEDKKYAGFWDL